MDRWPPTVAKVDEEAINAVKEQLSSAVGEAMLVRIEVDRFIAAQEERFDTAALRMAEIEAQLADTMDVSDGRAARAARRDRAGAASSSTPTSSSARSTRVRRRRVPVTEHQPRRCRRAASTTLIGAQLLVVLTQSWLTPHRRETGTMALFQRTKESPDAPLPLPRPQAAVAVRRSCSGVHARRPVAGRGRATRRREPGAPHWRAPTATCCSSPTSCSAASVSVAPNWPRRSPRSTEVAALDPKAIDLARRTPRTSSTRRSSAPIA